MNPNITDADLRRILDAIVAHHPPARNWLRGFAALAALPPTATYAEQVAAVAEAACCSHRNAERLLAAWRIATDKTCR